MGLICLPVHPQSNQRSMMDFLTLDSDIADGPRKTCPPLQKKQKNKKGGWTIDSLDGININ